MFLTAGYFTGELLIPNLSAITPAGSANIASLDWFIDRYEPEFLKYLLGKVLYGEFIAGLADGGDDDEAADKWDDLRDKIFTVTETSSQSPAAAYVYYFFRRSQVTATVFGGEVSTMHENATVVDANDKLVNAWNNMVNDSKVLWDWLSESEQRTLYPNFSREYAEYLTEINVFGI